MARSRSVCNPMPPEGCWIKFRLDLRNIKLEEVAKKGGVSVVAVSRVISGNLKSEKTQTALAEILGYQSWEQLKADALANTEKKGA